jgi:ferredoxin
LGRLYRKSGVDKAAEEAGIEVNLDVTSQAVSYPSGELVKRFEVITPVLEADGVFNLCKLKTHAFMSMTGAVKNNFGVIPGLAKPGYHAKLLDKGQFAGMLLDLAGYVSPRLSIMDAVVGMEGEGPGSAGTPRHVGLLLAARNQLALDVVASEIMGLSWENNPVLVKAEKRGLYPTHLEQVRVIGVDKSDLRIPDYKLPAAVLGGTGFQNLPLWQRVLSPLFKPGFTLKPLVIRDRCTACGVCRDSCPMQAIAMVDGSYAQIDDQACIRCYCCHEMCPHDAIELRSSLLHRIISRFEG